MHHVSCLSHLLSKPFQVATATHRRCLHVAVAIWNGSNGEWECPLMWYVVAPAVFTMLRSCTYCTDENLHPELLYCPAREFFDISLHVSTKYLKGGDDWSHSLMSIHSMRAPDIGVYILCITIHLLPLSDISLKAGCLSQECSCSPNLGYSWKGAAYEEPSEEGKLGKSIKVP